MTSPEKVREWYGAGFLSFRYRHSDLKNSLMRLQTTRKATDHPVMWRLDAGISNSCIPLDAITGLKTAKRNVHIPVQNGSEISSPCSQNIFFQTILSSSALLHNSTRNYNSTNSTRKTFCWYTTTFGFHSNAEIADGTTRN